jgi:hypothetical protein
MPRPSHPASNVRDDRDTPLLWKQDKRRKPLIWGQRKAEYFFGQDWTTQITLKDFKKKVFWIWKPSNALAEFRKDTFRRPRYA